MSEWVVSDTLKGNPLARKLSSLDMCTDAEKLVLIAIAALAKSLPNPSMHYINALGDITSKFTRRGGGERGVHNPMPGSLTRTHDVRVSPRWRLGNG